MDLPTLTTRIARLSDLHGLIERYGVRAVANSDFDRGMTLAHRSVLVEEALAPLLDEYDSLTAEEPEEASPILEVEQPRQHADGSGFTPFAWRHLLHDTGFAADHTVRPYIFGGSKPKRVRIETRTSLNLAFQFYTGREDVTHLWVQWTDGKRHLVHRKGL